jgi:hypothetical protein
MEKESMEKQRWMARCAVGLAGAMAVSVSSLAATYFVAPNGTAQGDGSREKPFSCDRVMTPNTLKPGDEAVFLDGVYLVNGPGRSAVNIKSVGNEKAPITYRAENRHKAILDGGTPVLGWTRAQGNDPIWEFTLKTMPGVRLFVDGEFLAIQNEAQMPPAEGMFTAEQTAKDEVKVRMRPWGGREPHQVMTFGGTVVDLSGAFNIVDGFVVRHGVDGVHVAGVPVHVYKNEGLYLEISGLANNAWGSFNILRNCIVRDMGGQGLTSNESRFNLIEDNVIYNAGIGQGDHGIYVSQGGENLTIRRNIWWRTAGAGVQIYSGTGIDSPRNVVVEYNIFGPDKRNRCFPLANRKSTAIYLFGGHRWAGNDRIVHNIVLGAHDRAISANRCNFNLIANNTFLNSDGAQIQSISGFGNLVLNNIFEYAPGGPNLPAGYFMIENDVTDLWKVGYNLYLPRDGKGKEMPAFEQNGIVASGDPFVDRTKFDVRLKPGSAALEMGRPIENVTSAPEGKKPAVGALDAGDEIYGQKGKFPTIPQWLLDEWPLSKRGQ